MTAGEGDWEGEEGESKEEEGSGVRVWGGGGAECCFPTPLRTATASG